MPVAEKDIYNLALSDLGTRSRVTATNDGSKEATALSIVYADVRDELLSRYPWSFAEIRKALTTQAVAVTPDDYSFVYARPANCLKFRYICLAGRPPNEFLGLPPIPYAVRAVEDDTTPDPLIKRAILCDVEDAVGCYTWQVTDVDYMPAHFRRALAWKLAEGVALNLTASREIAAACGAAAERQFEIASTIDAQEGLSKMDDQVAPWTAAR